MTQTSPELLDPAVPEADPPRRVPLTRALNVRVGFCHLQVES